MGVQNLQKKHDLGVKHFDLMPIPLLMDLPTRRGKDQEKVKIGIVVSYLGTSGVGTALVELVKVLSEEHKVEVLHFNRNSTDTDRERLLSEIAKISLIDGIDNLHSFFKEKMYYAVKSLRIRYLSCLLYHALCMKFSSGREKDIHHCRILPQHEYEYDIVISYQNLYGLSAIYPLYNMKAKHKIMWVHSEIDDYSIPKIEYPKFDRIVCVSNAIKTSIDNALPQLRSKTSVIYNILNEEVIRKKSREQIPFIKNDNEVLICSVGRLDVIKQYDLAIKAMSLVLKKNPKVRWIVCGEGADRSRLEEIIRSEGLEESFLLLGNIPNPYPYILLSDIFCHTSRSEGFGLVLQEAKILGKPVVCTNFQTANEIIMDNEDGFIVEQNPNAVAEAILFLVNDDNLRKRYSCWKRAISAEQSREKITNLMKELQE